MAAQSKLPVMISDEDIVDKRYENGKIYIVRCKYDDNLIYVGSTIRTLEERLKGHRTHYRCSLYQYVNGDWDNWFIELYEDYPCKNKKKLERREGEVQREIATINNVVAGRTFNELYKDNKLIFNERQKQYYHNNREKCLEYKKNAYIKHIEYLKEKQNIYRNKNIDIIKIKKKERMICDVCGKDINIDHKARHQRTNKCINFKT